MAQGFKLSKGSANASKGGKHAKGPRPGARVIKPKKSSAVQAAKIQKKINSDHVKRTECALMQKVRGKGEGQFRLIQADPKVLAAAAAAREKQAKKKQQETERPVKMAPKKNTD